MNIKAFLSILILVLGSACNLATPKNKNGSKGISITEKGLSGNVYLSDEDEQLEERIFYYGKKIFTNFTDMKGFIEEGGLIYPQMHMAVLSKKGDTVMQQRNMFAEPIEGIEASDPSMNGHIILARPIYSGMDYSMHYTIEDTKGGTVMTSKMDFKVISNPEIKLVSNGLDYSEAYIYSEDKDEVLNDGTFNFYENIRFDIQDIAGYTKKEGAIELGMSVKVLDDDGNEILSQDDVFQDAVYDEALLKKGLSATLVINEGRISNPLKWQVRIWDKNSEAKLKGQVVLRVK